MFDKINSFNGLAINIKTRLLFLFLIGMQVFIMSICAAQEKPAERSAITIKAQSIDPTKLPFPGQTLTLNAEVNNTRDFRLPIRLLAMRDGKFYEIAVLSGLLGANDKPQYKVEIPAPIAEIAYQFVLISPDGSAITSQRVSVRRSCIPNILPALGELPDEMDGSERFNVLLVNNKRMEQEISNLEKAAIEVDALSELITQ